jgi:hemoglobin
MLISASAAALLMLMQQAPDEGTDWDAEFGVEERERDDAAPHEPAALAIDPDRPRSL